MGSYFLHILVMAVLLCVSAFFSWSETGLFALSPQELRKLRERRGSQAAAALALLSRPRRLLIAVLFGNTLVNVSYFSIGALIVTGARHTHGALVASGVGAVIFLVLVTFGEVLPKATAVRMPLAASSLSAIPLYLFAQAISPVRVALGALLEAIGRIGRRPERQPYVTAEELQVALGVSEREGALGRGERSMIEQVIRLRDTTVREIMVPRVDMVSCEVGTSREDFLELVARRKATKIPVYQDDEDNVLGVVYAKDVVLFPERELRALVRPVYFVPEFTGAEALLRQFRERRIQFAIVVDEYGGVVGLVTLEDVMEEIVGELHDELEAVAEEPIKKIGEGEYLVRGELTVKDWNEAFGDKIESPSADTVGGFVMALLGRVPQEGDVVSHGSVTLTVRSVHRRRVSELLIQGREAS